MWWNGLGKRTHGAATCARQAQCGHIRAGSGRIAVASSVHVPSFGPLATVASPPVDGDHHREEHESASLSAQSVPSLFEIRESSMGPRDRCHAEAPANAEAAKLDSDHNGNLCT